MDRLSLIISTSITLFGFVLNALWGWHNNQVRTANLVLETRIQQLVAKLSEFIQEHYVPNPVCKARMDEDRNVTQSQIADLSRRLEALGG